MIAGPENDRFARERQRMVENDLKGRNITDPAVLSVMGLLSREEFVPESYHSQAYADCPLPIGMGQTISQPYIVALMTQELRLNHFCEVLEVGTGSGYQTAILAGLARKVYTIERFSELSASAQAVLGRLGITNVEFCIGDGSAGWPFFASSFAKATEDRDATKGRPEKRQFDRIIVTAAVPEIPQTLIDQLGEGGLIVAPVGGIGVQELVVGIKKEGKLIERVVCDVRFVKLVGQHAFEE
ncbi:MAG: protein-L-isoaspartate O-methyltransferase [Sedimentisphaerales bacterium]|jgi:protein-L-isoaspartate(D-aspartate) O-methyltransferase